MQALAEIPSHVPKERVVDFDIYFPPGVEADYFAAWEALKQSAKAAVVWTPRNGGHWIVLRGRDIRRLWADAARLSSEVLAVPPGLGEVMRFIPLQEDGSAHADYRKAVMRGFNFSYLVALEPQVQASSRELLQALLPIPGFDFVADVAEILPLNVFLGLIDVPVADRPMLREFGKQLTRPDGSMTAQQLADAANDYLRPYVEQRLDHPGEDLLSRILAGPVGDRGWTLEEAQRMCSNLLFAGLDTVAALLGFCMLHLARNPQDQTALRDAPASIPAAVDELTRRYASVSVSRNLIEDVDVDGVTLKRGDVVYLPSTLHNLDAESFDAPQRVLFDRNLSPLAHTTMGAGVHRCVGAGLARMELIVVLREWLERAPSFGLDPERPVKMKGGNVGACVSLPLRWTAPAAKGRA